MECVSVWRLFDFNDWPFSEEHTSGLFVVDYIIIIVFIDFVLVMWLFD